MTPNDELRAIMQERGYKNRKIAELLGLPVDPKRHASRTVQNWTSDRHPMPPQMLELLKLKLPPMTAPARNTIRT